VLKVMLNALGFYKRGETIAARGPEANIYTAETVTAVDAFRTSEKMGTPTVGGSPSGLVDEETVTRLWAALERAGKATAVRQQLLDVTMIRR
jgi:peptidoglycan hydrolase-like protein with peptidoglycan-binding domain